MSRSAPILGLLLSLLGTGLAKPAAGQSTEVRVEAIRLAPEEHVNEIRTLNGVVDRLVSREGAEEPAFYLEDDFGHQIMVVPFGGAPARGARVEVTGVVTLDAVGDPVVTVFDADGLALADGTTSGAAGGEAAGGGGGTGAGEAPAETAVGATTPRPTRRGWSPRWDQWLLWVGLFGAAIIATWLFLGRRVPAERPLVTGAPPPPPTAASDVDFATSSLWPESDAEFEGRTLRFIRPDPTVRLMSARLEVVSGPDAGQEIRFVATPGEPISMMFGRAPGEGEGCVTLKQKTVSRTHAVVRYRHEEWLLENLSLTNPTVLNGEKLGVKERLLTDGDRIEMGEVMFVFYE